MTIVCHGKIYCGIEVSKLASITDNHVIKGLNYKKKKKKKILIAEESNYFSIKQYYDQDLIMLEEKITVILMIIFQITSYSLYQIESKDSSRFYKTANLGDLSKLINVK
jgi:hypothetical protein